MPKQPKETLAFWWKVKLYCTTITILFALITVSAHAYWGMNWATYVSLALVVLFTFLGHLATRAYTHPEEDEKIFAFFKQVFRP